MRILVTNDDGIYSPGLWSAAEALKEVGEVFVVAPDRDLSGMGAAITLLSVVRAQEIAPPVEGVKAYSVQGTPADCVILAAEKLVKGPLDLVVSGINQGSNLGLDVITSGTVGGAFQGYFCHLTSIAVSVVSLSLTEFKYEAAARAARKLAKCLCTNAPPAPMLLNVNLPNLAPEMIKGVKITKLGYRPYLEKVEEGKEGRRTHYWINRKTPADVRPAEGSDIWVVRNNCISISQLDVAFSSTKPWPELQLLADGVAEELGLSNRG